MEKDKRDIYALALEKYLTFLEKFGTDKEDIFMVIYSSDTDLIGGKNYKSYETLNHKSLIKRYQEKIPNCLNCTCTYVNFLNSIKKSKQSTIDVDKRFLDIHRSLKSRKAK